MEIRKASLPSPLVAPLPRQGDTPLAPRRDGEGRPRESSKADDNPRGARGGEIESAAKAYVGQRAAAAQEAGRLYDRLSLRGKQALSAYQEMQNQAQNESRAELSNLLGVDVYV